MLTPGSFALTLLLSFLTAIGPLSMDMYLPSLPDIARTLHAPTVQAQLTISSYLFGFAIGQIFYGPLSDRAGRKPVLLVALLLYGAASVGCAIAPSMHGLIEMRFAQAMGGAGAIVLARAMVRDLYSGARAGRELSLMGAITGIAPIVAPMIGGILQTAFGWRSTFVLLVVFAVVATAAAVLLLPETMRQRTRDPFSWSAVGALYRSVATNRGFLAYIGIISTSFVGLFAWVSGAPIVMQSGHYGLKPLAFGLIYAVATAGYMFGTAIGTRTVMRFGLDRLIGAGTIVLMTGGFIMVLVVALDLANVIWLVIAMTIYLTGLGLALPSAMAGALTPFPDRAGTASSLMGFAQQGSAAAAAAAIGFYMGESAWPVAAAVATMGLLSFLIWLLTRRVRAETRSP
jgi:DHA1 family bicyclomycin/chloramphenicol resistance-like MFS transporter